MSTKTLPILLLIIFLNCESSTKNPIPPKIFNLTLKEQIEDPDATQQINKLHFQNVAAEKNEIAVYEGPNSVATIYVSYYRDNKTSQSEYEKMTQKISPENSVFIGGTYLEMNKVEIYKCFGMGQTHFVFAKDQLLFWVSVTTVISNDFIAAYLDILN
ncbi:MAG: hypothetical protein D8M58_00955 [Calditrichaeota bacterium]|nr:MAG: hypothetical protein DWQ03_06125 [Calditrichota bacterium]MBL1203936.1 hypothetical protein [Calditrichota bacterium]NOG43768.1 hypothetical protein [Calditrichota bacterium]